MTPSHLKILARRLLAPALVLVVVVGAALTLAACGGSDSTSGSGGSTGATGASSTSGGGDEGESKPAAAEYSGEETSVPSEFDEPAPKPGTKFVLGFLSPLQSETFFMEVAEGAEKEASRLGGSVIVKDAELNVEKQVSQFNELVSQGATAMMATLLDPEGEKPQIDQAGAKGIPIIGLTQPHFVNNPPVPGFASNVGQGNDAMAYYDAKAMAEASPEGEFAIITLAAAAVKDIGERVQETAEGMGLKYAETVELTELTPAAGSTAMSGLIASHPNLTAVWTLQEPLALGAESVARSSGKDIFITSENGSKVAIEAVAAGRLGATYRYDGYDVGVQAARGAYAAQTGQKLPKAIVVPGTPVTEENADEVLSELK